MAEDYIDQVKKATIGPPRRIVKQFDVADYVSNPALIEKLHEEKLIAVAEALDLKKRAAEADARAGGLDQDKHTLQGERDVLTVHLQHLAKQSTNALFVSIVAAVLVSIGANLATGSAKAIGALLIVVSVALEAIAFRMTGKPAPPP